MKVSDELRWLLTWSTRSEVLEAVKKGKLRKVSMARRLKQAIDFVSLMDYEHSE